MSETPDETQVPDAPPAPAEPLPEEEKEADEQEQDQTPAEAAEREGSETVLRKAAQATRSYHKRIEALLGPDPNRHECPACEGNGVIWGEPAETVTFAEDQTKEACPTCRGLGQLISHSKAPGHELVTCIECAGQGWRNKPSQAATVTPITPQPAVAAGPVMGFLNPDGSFAPFGQNMPQTVPQTG
jgi:hypothetical protein